MTAEKQQLAIAEACGWVCAPPNQPQFTHWVHTSGITRTHCPDYLHDLNAMHGAERMLTDEQWDDVYYHWLGFVVSGGRCEQLWEYRKLIVGATAAQRAEAFVRTIGKWEEDA